MGQLLPGSCRRLLSAWHDEHIWSVTTVITAIQNGDVIDRYHTSGTAVQQVGWKILDIATTRKPPRGKAEGEEQRAEQILPSDLKKGDPQDVVDVEAVKKTNVIRVGCDGPSPEVAQAIVTTLIDLYLEEHAGLNRTPGSYQFLNDQTGRLREQLSEPAELPLR